MNKKYRNFEYKIDDKYYEISEDLPEVGWYLKVYDRGMNCIFDHLQNDFKTIIDFAFEEYGIPRNRWTEK